MTGRIAARLTELGLTLPQAAAPVANYVPFVLTGNQLYISGQISQNANGPILGRLGETTSIEDGAAAARTCGLMLLAQAQAALGDLDRIRRVVKLTGFINSSADFTDQPVVMNGCSDLMVEILGDAGRHARSAVGVPTLPRGVAVEVDAVFEVE